MNLIDLNNYQLTDNNMATKLFVGGLSFRTTDNSLHDAFEKYGDIVEARVVLDRDSHRSRGFGFVTYAKAEDAEAAAAGMTGQELEGRQIRVDAAKEKERDSRPRGGSSSSSRYDDRRDSYDDRRGGRDSRDDRRSGDDRRSSDSRSGDDRRSGGGSSYRRDSGGSNGSSSSRRAPYDVSRSRSGGYSRDDDRERDRGSRDSDRDRERERDREASPGDL